MRISTSQIYESGTRNLLDRQTSLYKIQNQLATGKRFLSAEDDPVAAAQVLLTKQTLAINDQYTDNQSNASSQLAYEESRLQSVVESVQYIMERVVAGGSGTFSDSDRESIAKDLQSQFDFLVGMANSTDANGYYLFSGYQGDTQPFQKQLNPDGSVSVVYRGDEGQRLMQVGTSRQIAVSDSGRDVFERNRTGNGTFALAAAAGNQGTGVLGAGSVLDPTAWTGNTYQIAFTSATDYEVTNTATGAVVTGTYSADSAITAIPGISFSISGAPATGDTFTVSPSTNQSVFATLQNLISAFSTPISGQAVARASFRNTLSSEMANLNGILDNVLNVQASIGSRMNELDALSNVSESLDLQFQERLSNLQDLDYAAAISAFSQQQMQLEAAQSSFARISGLSLFNYL